MQDGDDSPLPYLILTDHLGSVDLITDRYGNVVDSMSFDAWGNRRNYNNWQQKDNTVHLIDRGFTMHQHLDSFNLINMGGRVYDPVVAQFLSPDPYVQAPDNTQNLNRYNYCYNSPLMYKDPTGEFIITFLVNAIAGAIRKEGFFNQGFEAIGNQFKIFGGLFTSDKNKNGWAQIGEVVNRFTWQFAQTSVGYFFNQFMNTFAGVSNVDYSNGATVINSRWINGAVTLGSFISGDASLAADPNNSLFQHEYGHYLQSQYMGPAYLSRVGIPSLFGALGKNTHDIQVYEQDANYRAFVYFNKRVEGFYQTEEEFWTNFYNGTEKGWNFVNNPLDLTHENIRGTYYDYKNPEHLSQVNSWRLKAEWYEYAWGTVDPFSNALFIGSGNHIYNNPRRP
jgi:RHS repeat-associated protein